MFVDEDCSDDILVISIVVIFFFCQTLLGARRLGCNTPTNGSVLRLCQTIEEMKAAPGCVTLHPTFKIVCLERWSLRLAAGKYRTIDKKSYQQSGSEEA